MNIRKICTCLSCFLLVLSLTPLAQARGITAFVADGPVSLNGQKIDNSSAQYPLLVYHNITYIPMTYDLCRFLGLSADWDSTAGTLSIDRLQGSGNYVPDTGHARAAGSVSVTKVTYPIVIRGIPEKNPNENYPLLNYNNVTYFPLTYHYAADAFGWMYYWDASAGLIISSQNVPAVPSTGTNTGIPALDTALEILNQFYQQSHTYSGTLTDRRNGSVQRFTAAVNVETDYRSVRAELTAEPFVFFDNGASVTADWSRDALLTDNPSFGISTRGYDLWKSQMSAVAAGTTELEYLAECFLDCQFSGERAGKILSSSQAEQNGVTVWQLTVSFSENGFEQYHAAVTIDDGNRTVPEIEISTENYTLYMAAAD